MSLRSQLGTPRGACVTLGVCQLQLVDAIPCTPCQLFTRVHHVIGHLTLELHRAWYLADFACTDSDVRLQVGQDELHPLRQLGTLKGFVDLGDS